VIPRSSIVPNGSRAQSPMLVFHQPERRPDA
jgi:hypothetical protein